MKAPKSVRSDIAWATPDKIVVHNLDLCKDILGKVDFGQMAFLSAFGRLPEEKERRLFNAMMVILVEHGITPSSIAARMTYTGAPESVQAAIAAGLLGLGSVFVGSLDNAARMLQEAIPDPKAAGDLDKLATQTVERMRAGKQIIPGIGHPFHKPIDPRAPALFKVAEETDFSGPYVALMQKIGATATKLAGKPLPVNATGAMAAVASEFRLPWQVCRGLAVAARAVGLVGHIVEEMRQPMGETLYFRIEEEASRHLIPKEKK